MTLKKTGTRINIREERGKEDKVTATLSRKSARWKPVARGQS